MSHILNMKSKPYILVKWIDATYDVEGWQSADESHLTPMEMETVGILHQDGDEFLTITQTSASDDGYMNRFTIPKGCIRSVELLTVSTDKKTIKKYIKI